MKAALYARVSTTDQNCSSQLRELREYCERRGWQVSGEYVDTGWSGAKASRPELDRLMKDAAVRRFDATLVYKLDRGSSIAPRLWAFGPELFGRHRGPTCSRGAVPGHFPEHRY
jgi:DNA invertase Pin-like site-specific DNA recombinase